MNECLWNLVFAPSQESCARLLLSRGANKTLTNLSNQDPVTAALVAGNQSLADVIRNFKQEDVGMLIFEPKTGSSRIACSFRWLSYTVTMSECRSISLYATMDDICEGVPAALHANNYGRATCPRTLSNGLRFQPAILQLQDTEHTATPLRFH